MIFGQAKKKRVVIAPLVITFNTGNPPFHQWIKENLSILHEDQKAKKAIPSINVVTRQAKNIEKEVIRSRHWAVTKPTQTRQPPPPSGNFKLHCKNCVTCKRMEDGKTEYHSAKTGRTY